jgi:transposase-like protein
MDGNVIDMRKWYDGNFKAKIIIIEALRGQKTIAETASEYGVLPT